MLALLNGIGWGLFLTILVGPIFLSLVQTGLEKGIRLGLAIAAGIFISDLLFILFIYWGLGMVTFTSTFYLYLGIIGGILLCVFGIAGLFTKVKEFEPNSLIQAKTYGGYFMKGLLINTVNPFTVFFWITIATTVVSKYTREDSVFFYIGIIITILITDVSKVLLSNSLRKILTTKALQKAKVIGGIAMIIFGVILFVRIIFFPPEVQ